MDDPREGGGVKEFICVTVLPCGLEDGSHNFGEENKMKRPYQLKIHKRSKCRSLNQIVA